MSTKKSVFLSTPTVDWIESTTINGDSNPKWSESINATFSQFRYLIAGALPELTMDEWQIILNVYAGSYLPAHGFPPRIAGDIMDDVGAISIDSVENLMPKKAELIRKVHAMSQLEQLAVLYFAQIFWLNKWDSEWPEIVEAIKAKMTGK